MSFKFTWILVNKLSIGSAPQSIKDIDELTKMGIRSILSLNDLNETIFLKDLGEKFDHKRFVLPDHKYNKIAKIEEIEKVLEILDSLLKKSPVFVHCLASVERSPLIAIALLVKKMNLTPQEALAYTMQVHPGTSPDTKQLVVLDKLKSNKK